MHCAALRCPRECGARLTFVSSSGCTKGVCCTRRRCSRGGGPAATAATLLPSKLDEEAPTAEEWKRDGGGGGRAIEYESDGGAAPTPATERRDWPAGAAADTQREGSSCARLVVASALAPENCFFLAEAARREDGPPDGTNPVAVLPSASPASRLPSGRCGRDGEAPAPVPVTAAVRAEAVEGRGAEEAPVAAGAFRAE